MPVNGCVVVALDGTHGSGKTTLLHALSSYYQEKGVVTAYASDPARGSPFVEDVIVRGFGAFDAFSEVDLFTSQLSQQIRATRYIQLLFCDKSIISTLAYSSHYLLSQDRQLNTQIVDAMSTFCRAWIGFYDTIFFVSDHFKNEADVMRSKSGSIQQEIENHIEEMFSLLGVYPFRVPVGRSLAARVQLISGEIDKVLNLETRNKLSSTESGDERV